MLNRWAFIDWWRRILWKRTYWSEPRRKWFWIIWWFSEWTRPDVQFSTQADWVDQGDWMPRDIQLLFIICDAVTRRTKVIEHFMLTNQLAFFSPLNNAYYLPQIVIKVKYISLLPSKLCHWSKQRYLTSGNSFYFFYFCLSQISLWSEYKKRHSHSRLSTPPVPCEVFLSWLVCFCAVTVVHG